MQFDYKRMSPRPKETSLCECCNTKLVAKCGRVNIWHWAHESKKECDEWYETITEWHLGWQACVPVEMREIYIKNEKERHFADIKLPSGIVVEIQHSSLNEDTIEEREEFYKDMIWILDGINLLQNIKRYDKVSKSGNNYVAWYYYYRPKQWVGAFRKQVYIDYGEQILRVNSNFDDGTYFTPVEEEKNDEWGFRIKTSFKGWGKHLTREQAKKEIFGQYYLTSDNE